jgi:hypothetical protein
MNNTGALSSALLSHCTFFNRRDYSRVQQSINIILRGIFLSKIFSETNLFIDYMSGREKGGMGGGGEFYKTENRTSCLVLLPD